MTQSSRGLESPGIPGRFKTFLVLRAENVGLAIALVPIMFIVMNIVYAVSAYSAGTLSERMARRIALAAGLVVHNAADAVFRQTTSSPSR